MVLELVSIRILSSRGTSLLFDVLILFCCSNASLWLAAIIIFVPLVGLHRVVASYSTAFLLLSTGLEKFNLFFERTKFKFLWTKCLHFPGFFKPLSLACLLECRVLGVGNNNSCNEEIVQLCEVMWEPGKVDVIQWRFLIYLGWSSVRKVENLLWKFVLFLRGTVSVNLGWNHVNTV